jgi:diaminopimelate decarboxylase
MDPLFAHQLIEKHGSPVIAYDLDVVRARTQSLLAAFPEKSRLFYSLKANPLPAIVRAARESGAGAEVTSMGELRAAVAGGCLAKDLLLGGPGKTHSEITEALKEGVRWFSCESFVDAKRISDAAIQVDEEAQVLLRINPSEAPDARLAMSGVDSQFGFEEAHLLSETAAEQLSLPGFQLRGTHIYFGTQMSTVEAIADNTRRALEATERVCQHLAFEPDVVDVGGGFSWPYAADGDGPDYTGMKEALAEVWQASPLHQTASLWFESGRHLCAGSGTLLTTVQDVKASKTRTYIVLDTGIHHLGGMSGLGRLPRSTITLHNLTAAKDNRETPEETALEIAGPLCSPLDSLARNLKIPAPNVGDLLAIPNVGAYGLTASLIGFLSHDAPVEIAHDSGRLRDVWRWQTGHQSLSS